MKRLVPLFLLAACLASATIACGLSATPTEAPTEAPTEQPTEVPTDTPIPTPTETPTPPPTPTPSGPSLGDTWTRPADGMAMVYVPEGEFEMGSDDDDAEYAFQLCSAYRDDCIREWFEGEQPAHTVALDSFWIDQTEVTNEQYGRCVEAGVCEPPGGSDSDTSAYDDYPIVGINWNKAATYCEWAGARLPTEAEWEYAARGPEGTRFPWGDGFDSTRLNYCDANCDSEGADHSVDDGYAETAPVGSYPAGASWCGALDMAGNVGEWVADWYAADYYSYSPSRNPTGPSSGELRVVRGGGWSTGPRATRGAARGRVPPVLGLTGVGFRCAMDSE